MFIISDRAYYLSLRGVNARQYSWYCTESMIISIWHANRYLQKDNFSTVRYTTLPCKPILTAENRTVFKSRLISILSHDYNQSFPVTSSSTRSPCSSTRSPCSPCITTQTPRSTCSTTRPRRSRPSTSPPRPRTTQLRPAATSRAARVRSLLHNHRDGARGHPTHYLVS